eukprot:scaffold154361_cov35-Attheya_sp.AAC.1
MAPRHYRRSCDPAVKRHILQWHRNCDRNKLCSDVIGQFLNQVITRDELEEETHYRVCATIARKTKGMKKKKKQVPLSPSLTRMSPRLNPSAGNNSTTPPDANMTVIIQRRTSPRINLENIIETEFFTNLTSGIQSR